jgi:hypothetical protein
MTEEFLKVFENLPEEGKKAVLDQINYQKIRWATRDRLKADKNIQGYFEDYNTISVDLFINYYAIKKANWLTHFDTMERVNEYVDFKYNREAWHLLALVQKRKAMQKIADWNAYQADFDGIETSIDFALWDADIFNLPYLEPIEKDEVEICKKFFLSEEYEETGGGHIMLPTTYSIVRHDAGINNTDDTDHDFLYLYDTLRGAGTYKLLPTTKTDIENKYEQGFRDFNVAQQEKEIAEGKKKPYVRDERSSISADDYRQLNEFIKEFEDKEVMEKFRSYTHFYRDDMKDSDLQWRDEQIEHNLHNMLNEDWDVPVEAAGDLRTALEKAFKEYEKQKTLNALDSAYEDYLFRTQNGLAFAQDEKRIERSKDWIRRTKEYLIKARVHAGEPPNLNMF